MTEKLYLAAPFFTLRMPSWSIEDFEAVLAHEDIIQLYESDVQLQEAIAIASPSLHLALQQKPLKDPEQVTTSLFNYMVRMATRATPFGLFSFVRMGTWDQETEATFDLKQVHKKVRPDMEWLFSWIQKLPAASVRANPLARLKGNRCVLNYVIHAKKPVGVISIRANGLVRAILSLAKQSISIEELWKQLKVALPVLERERTLEVVRSLLENQILLPANLPSLLSNPSFKDLKEVAQDVQVDSAYRGWDLTLSKGVAEELEKALSLLWKISSHQTQMQPLQDYLEKFIEKYGTHRTVPLLEVLGTFQKRAPSEQMKGKFSKDWEKWLHRAWQNCLHENTQEILLDEKEIDRLISLSDEKPGSANAALPAVDVFCKLFADSPQRIDQGEFSILFSQLNWFGGSTLGRFLHVLDEDAQSQLQQYYQREEQLEPDALVVEISYWPSVSRFANVAIHPCLRSMRLDLADENSLSLEDIYVGVAEGRFYLTLKEGGCELIPRTGNLLNPDYGPEFVQFMRDVSKQRHCLFYPFSWGKLERSAVFLPRVRFGKVILSPAKWNLDGALFKKDHIIEQFNEWAKKWKLPHRFLLVREDQHLLVDRSHPIHLSEIARKLKQGELLQFIEEDGSSWVKSERGHHLTELVCSFLKNPIYTKKNAFNPLPHLAVSQEERLKLPGSQWLYVKFYLDEEVMDDFLIHHLAPFAEELGDWYFVRYADPEKHLRFRVKFPTGDVLLKLEEATRGWMQAGLIKNLTICAYEREIERYGGLEHFEDIEALFCADTQGVIQMLQSIKWEPVVLHTLSIIALVQDFNLGPEETLSLLAQNDSASLQGYRTHKKQLLELVKALNDSECPLYQASQLRQPILLKLPLVLDVYKSILHMHCNRLGCDNEAEKKAKLYAHHTLVQLQFSVTF